MIINKLSLSNFRRFSEFNTRFHPRLTVFVARNGQGKTSVLDAIAIALGTFVGAFDNGKGRSIERSDSRYQRRPESAESEQQYPVRVSSSFTLPDQKQIDVLRELNGPNGKTTIKDAHPITQYGSELMEQVRKLASVTLPVISYYGSGRLWVVHKDMQRKKVLSESRSLGYEDCLSSASNFKQLQQWMGKATLAAMQQRQMEAYQGYTLADQLAGIQHVVDQVLAEEGWHNFHYSLTHEELAMQHDDLGLLPVSLLSDGVRAMVSLVADLAWRCAKLNPQLGKEAPQQTPGIVLIDEVDLHLHPAWQQRVIQSLTKAFPSVQFILTTHSPQVLSTVKSESIRMLINEADESGQTHIVAHTHSRQTQGVASADLLAEIMDTDPVPQLEVAGQLSDYKALIQQGLADTNQAQQLRNRLVEHFGDDHPVLAECNRLIRLQTLKQKHRMLASGKED